MKNIHAPVRSHSRPARGTRSAACWTATALLAIGLGWPTVSQADTGDAEPARPAAGTPASVPAATARYCNQKSILVRYRWEGPDPAGVQMWIRIGEESWLPWQWSDRPGEPITFTPPRQGRITIALGARDMETAAAPTADCQTLAVCFDWDKPLLRLISARMLVIGSPILRLGWAAWDENLGDRPISIYWRSSPQQPWQTGQADLPNSGVFEWPIPGELAGQKVEVSLRATDLAGNTAEIIVAIEAPGKPAGGVIAAESHKPPAATSQPAAVAQIPAPTPASATASAPAPAPQPDTLSLEAERFYQLAQQALARNNLEVTEDLLRQALEADPAFYHARLQLAIILQRRGQGQQAVREYEAVLATRPDNTTAWRNLALAYTTAKDYPKARVTLQKLLAVDSNSPQTWLDLGDVEMLSGRPDAARQYWEKAREISKPDTETYTKAGKRLSAYVRKGS